MPEDLFELLKSGNRLPSPPGVAMRVLELARAPEPSLADIAEAISSDPTLSARILRFVNSPMAGVRRQVSSLNQAVTLIGLLGVKTITLSFSLVSLETKKSCPSFDYVRFWSRSLACAVAARAIVQKTKRYDAEEAFMAGLLTRIGQLVLACGVPDAYERVLQTEKRQPSDLLTIEREIIRATHIEIGARLLEEWQLPEPIWRSIVQYGNVDTGSATEQLLPLAPILYTANLAASVVCDSIEQSARKVEDLMLAAENLLGIDSESWSEVFEQIAEQWHEYGELLTIKTTDVKSFSEMLSEAREQMAQLSLATQLENQEVKERNEELLQQSRTDRLTGVGNRAAFDERLAVELERARRTERPMALFLADVDHFKAFNDTYGHQAGDQVLQEVANALDNAVRKIDFVARYGGEEFAVIAPECIIEGALSLAERLRAAVEEVAFEWKDQSLQVTISVGVALAQWPHEGQSAEGLIAVADKQLYAAKRAGRNCYKMAPYGTPVITE